MKLELIVSYIREIIVNLKYIFLFSFIFGILSLSASFFVTPLFNSKIDIMVSGTGLNALSMQSSPNIFGMMGSNAILADESAIAVSQDLKIDAFASFAMKVKWHEIDKDIRHFVVFDTVSLMAEPRTMRIVPLNETSYEIHLAKNYSGLEKIKEKLPRKRFDYYKTANTGEIVTLFNGSNFMITSPELKTGNKYDIEIYYKYPRDVMASLFPSLSVAMSQNSSIFSIAYTGSDPVKTTEFVNYYAQKYLKSRYSKARFDGSQTALFFNERIGHSKSKVDSLQTELGDFASKESIFMPEHEVPEVMNIFMQAVNERQMLELNYIMAKQMNPYNNLQTKAIRTQMSAMDKHINSLNKKIYSDYPDKISTYLNINAFLKAEEKILSELILKREQALLAEIAEIGNRWIVEHPTFPFFRIQPQRFRDLVVYLSFGFFIGLLFVVFKRVFNPVVSIVFDLGNKKIITVSKIGRNNSEKIKKEIDKIFSSFGAENSVIGFVKEMYSDFDEFSKETELEKFEKIDNISLYPESLTKKETIIIPIKYNFERKKDLETIFKVLDERVIFIVYNIEPGRFEYKWDYYTNNCIIE